MENRQSIHPYHRKRRRNLSDELYKSISERYGRPIDAESTYFVIRFVHAAREIAPELPPDVPLRLLAIRCISLWQGVPPPLVDVPPELEELIKDAGKDIMHYDSLHADIQETIDCIYQADGFDEIAIEEHMSAKSDQRSRIEMTGIAVDVVRHLMNDVDASKLDDSIMTAINRIFPHHTRRKAGGTDPIARFIGIVNGFDDPLAREQIVAKLIAAMMKFVYRA